MSRRTETVALAAVVLLGLALRLGSLTAGDLTSDEATSWEIATAPTSEVSARLVALEVKPPLYFLTLHAWLAVFPDGEASLRALSAAFWPPFAIVLFLLGRRICGRAALLPVLLAALSPVLIQQGLDARPYSMLLCAETVFLYLAFRADEEPTPASRAMLAAGAFAVLSVQFTGIFFLAPVLLAVLLPRRRDLRELARFLVPLGVAGVLYAASLVLLTPGLLRRVSGLQDQWWASSPSVVQILSSPVRLIAPVQSWKTWVARPAGLLLMPAAAILTALSAAGLAVSGRRRLLLAAAGSLVLVAAYSLARANLLFERYYIGCAPVLLLGAAAALERLRERRPAAARAALPAAVAAQVVLFLLLPAYAGSTGYRRAVGAVRSAVPGPAVLLTTGWDTPAVRYYVRHEAALRVLPWSGSPAEALDARSPLYFLHSNSWGERTGETAEALRRVGARLSTIHDADRVTVYRVDRP